MSAYSIARDQLTQLQRNAEDAGIDEELLLRALMGSLVERYRELRGVDDLRAILQYQMDNVRGDEDHEFMRP